MRTCVNLCGVIELIFMLLGAQSEAPLTRSDSEAFMAKCSQLKR